MEILDLVEGSVTLTEIEPRKIYRFEDSNGVVLDSPSIEKILEVVDAIEVAELAKEEVSKFIQSGVTISISGEDKIIPLTDKAMTKIIEAKFLIEAGVPTRAVTFLNGTVITLTEEVMPSFIATFAVEFNKVK